MPIQRTAQPAIEPITLAEAKLHLRVDHSEEDALISALIAAARTECENRLQRTLITTGWTWPLDAFPAGGGLLVPPMPPLITVGAIQYVDTDGATQTLSGSGLLHIDPISEPGRIAPVSGSWPATADRINAVTITYTAGYGPAEADVPAPIRQWLLLAIGDMYANRERSAERPKVPQGFADSLLDPYRIYAL
jgi:uncharacterized phiE125 gp8 family phage protein